MLTGPSAVFVSYLWERTLTASGTFWWPGLVSPFLRLVVPWTQPHAPSDAGRCMAQEDTLLDNVKYGYPSRAIHSDPNVGIPGHRQRCEPALNPDPDCYFRVLSWRCIVSVLSALFLYPCARNCLTGCFPICGVARRRTSYLIHFVRSCRLLHDQASQEVGDEVQPRLFRRSKGKTEFLPIRRRLQILRRFISDCSLEGVPREEWLSTLVLFIVDSIAAQRADLVHRWRSATSADYKQCEAALQNFTATNSAMLLDVSSVSAH